jgi:hypothetical protein
VLIAWHIRLPGGFTYHPMRGFKQNAAESRHKESGLQNRSGTSMCRRDEHASACRDKGGAALPRPFVCKPLAGCPVLRTDQKCR